MDMTTGTSIPTSTEVPHLQSSQAAHESSLMQLMWLASPALPIGGFSYSEGLEALVNHAELATEFIATEWLTDQLHLTLARGDLAVVAKAIEAWRDGSAGHARCELEERHLARLSALNAWVLQTRESSEFKAQTEQMGRSLLEWLRNHTTATSAQIEACAQMQPTYPVAFALAASSTQARARDCLLAYAFGWAENMVQAAIKSVPLGQSAGQRILSALAAEIPAAVDYAVALDGTERQAFSPMLAIRSAQHETQYSRLFRS
jgi:urease accessory protein